jgi:O-antigen ligase
MHFDFIFTILIPLIFLVLSAVKDKKFLVLLYYYASWMKYGLNIGFTIVYVLDLLNIIILLLLLRHILIVKRLKIDIIGKYLLVYTILFYLHMLLGYNDDTPRFLYEMIMIFPTYLFFLTIIKSLDDWIKIIKYYISAYILIVVAGLILFIFPSLFTKSFYNTYTFFDLGIYRQLLLQPSNYLLIPALIFLKGFKRISITSLLFLLLILSGGRSALISGLITLIVMIYYLTKKNTFQILFFQPKFIIIILLISIGIYWGSSELITNSMNNPDFLKRYYQLIVNPELAGGARINYYTESLEQTKKNIYGWNHIFNNRKLRYVEEGLSTAITGRTHNQYLAVLYAYGLFGLIFFIFFIGTTIYVVSQIRLKTYSYRDFTLILFAFIFIRILEGGTTGVYYDSLVTTIILALATKANLNKKWFINVEKDKNYVK